MIAKKMQAQMKVNVPETGLPSPEAANWFHFRHHMGDVEMLIGYIGAGQIEKVVPRLAKGESVDALIPETTRRIVLPLAGFVHLRSQVESIHKKLLEAGLLEDLAGATDAR